MTVQQETSPQWVTYLDITNDVKPYLRYPSGSSSDDALIQLYTDMACQWVQNFLGRPVAQTEFYRLFSGYSGFNGSYIHLPYYPVIGAVTVVETWGTSGQHTLVEQTPGAQGSPGQQMFQVDRLRGIIIRSFTGLIARPWFPGLRNVEVTWEAGYNPLPADIKLATLKLVKHWWTQDQQASRTFQRGPEEGLVQGPGMWGGIPQETKDLLSAYVQVGIA